MLKIIAVVIMALTLNSAFAVAHDQDSFPQDALLILEGQDAVTKEECFLFVMDVSQDANAFSAKVLTSYIHGHDTPQAITVQAIPDRPEVLVGTGANGQDQMAIFLSSNNLDLRQANSFNLKWLHGNHFHTNRCLHLQVHED